MEEETNELARQLDVINRVIDKSVAVNAWIRVSLVGIELLAIEAKVIVTLVETYLKYAESTRLNAPSAREAIQSSSYSY
jgi:hypothetical protein